jgi:DNA-binding LacI/PurR family transcriptional regulator
MRRFRPLDTVHVTVHNPHMNVTGHTREPGRAGSRPARSVSIRDVAAAAGVSHQTVSRVINGHASVKSSTRELVLAAIRDLGFRPNRAARVLAGGPAQSVTVLASNTTLYGYAATLQGIEEAGRAAGFAVGIRVLESATEAEVEDAMERAIEPGGAIIVIAFDRTGVMTLRAVPPGVPMAAAVEARAEDEAEGRPWAWIDDRKAAVDATRYLLGLGHDTVYYVPIPASTDTSPRMAGWRSALLEAGAPVPEPTAGGWDPRAGYRAGRALAAEPDVTAILCGNDDLALGVVRAMHEAGRAIPASVSVVGIDDTPYSALLTPALTTVRLDFVGLGRACFALLRGEPGSAGTTAGAQLAPELIVRESAGPPPRRGEG